VRRAEQRRAAPDWQRHTAPAASSQALDSAAGVGTLPLPASFPPLPRCWLTHLFPALPKKPTRQCGCWSRRRCAALARHSQARRCLGAASDSVTGRGVRAGREVRLAAPSLTLGASPSLSPSSAPLLPAGCTPCSGYPTAYSTATPNLEFIGARFSTAYTCMSIGAIDARAVVLVATPLNVPTLSRGVSTTTLRAPPMALRVAKLLQHYCRPARHAAVLARWQRGVPRGAVHGHWLHVTEGALQLPRHPHLPPTLPPPLRWPCWRRACRRSTLSHCLRWEC
jgi:hypothetical protein